MEDKLIRNEQEAIECIKNNMPSSGYEMLKESLNMAMKALERQNPRKLYYESDGDSDGQPVYDYANCPICGHGFEYGIHDWESNYCPDCGQALDWH